MNPESEDFSEPSESSEDTEESSLSSSSVSGFIPVSRTRSGRVTRPVGHLDPSTGKTVHWQAGAVLEANAAETNYYQSMIELDNEEVAQNIEYANVGAAIGGGYGNTMELKPMTIEEALSGPDATGWQKEIENEHNRMIKMEVFEEVEIEDLPRGSKPINSTWAMKKKSSGVLRGRVVARGFKQRAGLHYDPATISLPVTCNVTIRIVFVMMLLAGWTARVVDVKGAFLHGGFENDEKIFMKIPKGFEKYYSKTAVLRLR